DLDLMLAELDELLGLAASGLICRHPRFENTPPQDRRLNDVAFAVDGEPTTYPHLKQAIEAVNRLRDAHNLPGMKVIVLTNALLLHKPEVMEALSQLKAGPYELWAKLDGGTPEYFKAMAGRNVSVDRIVNNIATCAALLEVTI